MLPPMIHTFIFKYYIEFGYSSENDEMLHCIFSWLFGHWKISLKNRQLPSVHTIQHKVTTIIDLKPMFETAWILSKKKTTKKQVFVQYSMRIDFFTNRTFCEQNQKFDRNSFRWLRYTSHLRGLIIPEKLWDSGQARPVEALSNFWFCSQKVRFVKKSMRILYLAAKFRINFNE